MLVGSFKGHELFCGPYNRHCERWLKCSNFVLSFQNLADCYVYQHQIVCLCVWNKTKKKISFIN